MMLIPKLVRAANIWAEENERSLSRLATIVVNDGKLFDRIAGGGSCTVATYERLTAYLRDRANWTKTIPSEAVALLGLVDAVAELAADHAASDAPTEAAMS